MKPRMKQVGDVRILLDQDDGAKGEREKASASRPDGFMLPISSER